MLLSRDHRLLRGPFPQACERLVIHRLAITVQRQRESCLQLQRSVIKNIGRA